MKQRNVVEQQVRQRNPCNGKCLTNMNVYIRHVQRLSACTPNHRARTTIMPKSTCFSAPTWHQTKKVNNFSTFTTPKLQKQPIKRKPNSSNEIKNWYDTNKAQLYRHRFQTSYSSTASLVQNGPTASLAAELQEHAPAASIAKRSVLIPLQQRPAASPAAATPPSSSQKAPSKTAPLQPQSASSGFSSDPRAPAPAIAGNNHAKPYPNPGTTPLEHEQCKSQSGDPAARIRTTLTGSRFERLLSVHGLHFTRRLTRIIELKWLTLLKGCESVVVGACLCFHNELEPQFKNDNNDEATLHKTKLTAVWSIGIFPAIYNYNSSELHHRQRVPLQTPI